MERLASGLDEPNSAASCIARRMQFNIDSRLNRRVFMDLVVISGITTSYKLSMHTHTT